MKLFLTIFFLSVSAFAHQDSIIEQKGESLLGLPEEYEPARFHKQNMTLRLGNSLIYFPDCFREFLTIKDTDRLRVAASWYHDIETAPPYLTISIGLSGFHSRRAIMLDMDTLLPIDTGFTYGETKEEKECVKQFTPTRIL